MKHGFLDKYSDLDSFIHRLDPRPKVLSILAFVFTVAWAPKGSLSPYGVAFGLVVTGVLLSKVPFAYVALRAATVLPFSFFIASVRLLTEGKAALPLALFLGLKAWVSAMALVLLVSTTPFPLLLKGLEALGFPRVITYLLAFMYRYVFLIVEETMRMKRAWELKGGGNKWWISFRALAQAVGVLFIRSYERAERVYQAMCARGFEGEIRTMRPLVFGLSEALFSTIAGLSIGSLWILWALEGRKLCPPL